jgi:putative ABC transport system ATP-binding protein
VALARAFGPAPRLILADEPTGNLDGATGRQVIDLLFAAQARHGTTLVLITHDRELARQCQRTVHLADGRILGEDAERAHGEAASATGPRAIRG